VNPARRGAWVLSLAALTAFGCALLFSAAMLRTRGGPALNGTPVAVETRAELGRSTYAHYCQSCHGERGDGHGPSAEGMRPPPRDFTRGEFKFTRTGYGNLPSDAALEHTVRHGLSGTPMQGWDLRPDELTAVVAHLMTFSSRLKEEAVPEELELSADPWTGREREGVKQGELVYHQVGCASCHPQYAPEPSLERVGLKDGIYGERVLPISFTVHALKSGSSAEDIYRVVAGGIGGASMPGWKETLSEEQLWAIAHYVHSLAEKARDPRRAQAH
jgi:mono/diheme cytochrome c family protein